MQLGFDGVVEIIMGIIICVVVICIHCTIYVAAIDRYCLYQNFDSSQDKSEDNTYLRVLLKLGRSQGSTFLCFTYDNLINKLINRRVVSDNREPDFDIVKQ